ncbi:MAG: RDD family protein [Eubacterium sp.]|nr:RDD family protein [Eubacterium sp.]
MHSNDTLQEEQASRMEPILKEEQVEDAVEETCESIQSEVDAIIENVPVVQDEDIDHEIAPTDTSSPRSKRVVRKRNNSSRVYAGFFVRLTAYLLDKIIIGVPLVIVRLILWMLQDSSSSSILLRKVFFSFTLTDIILYLVSIAYFVLMTYFMGRTFGKRIMKLRVVSAEDRKLTFFEVAFREIIGRYLSTVILYIGYFMIGAGDQKEALHDYLADTRVVYALD